MTAGRRSQIFRKMALLSLLLLGLVVRVVQAVREPVVNPDAIRFIEQAKALWVDPLAAIRQEVYHPLHSLLGGVVFHLIHGAFRDERMAWLAAMQTVGIAAGVCVIWMIVKLSRHFGAPWWAALGGGLLFAVGRRTSSYGPDGISDMLFLALFGGAILAGMNTRLRFKPGWWMLAGVLAGLSYLTRPEGAAAVIVLLAAIVLAYVQNYLRHSRREGVLDFVRGMERRRHGVRCAVLLLVGFAVVGGPYMVAIGRFTAKKKIFEQVSMSAAVVPGSGERYDSGSGGMQVLAQVVPVPAIVRGDLWFKIWTELLETFGPAACVVIWFAVALRSRPWGIVAGASRFNPLRYVLRWPLAWGRRHWRPLVTFWMLLWLVVMAWLINKTSTPGRLGYLDGRHTLPFQLALHALFGLALGIWQLPMVWWQNWWRGMAIWPRLPGWMRSNRWPIVFAWVVCLLGCLPGIMRLGREPAHDKQYIRDAANWIAKNEPRDYAVADVDQLVGYYSGHEYRRWDGSPGDPELSQLPDKVILAYRYYTAAKGVQVAERIGPFVALPVRFKSDSSSQGDLLVLYARPSR
jgi:hypothetical protein